MEFGPRAGTVLAADEGGVRFRTADATVHYDARAGAVVTCADAGAALALGTMSVVGTSKSGRAASATVTHATFATAPRAALAAVGVGSPHFAFELRDEALVVWYHTGAEARKLVLPRDTAVAVTDPFTAHATALAESHTVAFVCKPDPTKPTRLASVDLVLVERDFGEGRIVARACQPTQRAGKYAVLLADGSAELVLERDSATPGAAKVTSSIAQSTDAQVLKTATAKVVVDARGALTFAVDADKLDAVLLNKHAGVHVPPPVAGGGKVWFRVADPDAPAPSVSTRATFWYEGDVQDGNEPEDPSADAGKVDDLDNKDTRLYVPALDEATFKDLFVLDAVHSKKTRTSVLLTTPDGEHAARLVQDVDNTKKTTYTLVVDTPSNAHECAGVRHGAAGLTLVCGGVVVSVSATGAASIVEAAPASSASPASAAPAKDAYPRPSGTFLRPRW